MEIDDISCGEKNQHQKKERPSLLLLYMICHDEASYKIATDYATRYAWISPILIPNTKFMESIVFYILRDKSHEWKDKTHIGIIKYSFEEKCPFYDFPYLCQQIKDMDVMTFVNGHEDNYNIPNPTMINYAGICHTLFPVIWYLLLKQFQIPVDKMFDASIPSFYSNFWIAKTHCFEEYMNFFQQTLSVMETNEELKFLLHQNANYLQRLPVERLYEIMNVPYYTYHCFICERLPCFFFWAKGYSILQIGGTMRRIKNNPDPSIPLLR
jgi:hypothetical protein